MRMMDLRHPPIIEATAQINYQTSSPLNSRILRAAADLLKFPHSETISEIALSQEGAKLSEYGVKVSDPIAGYVVQVTRDFIAISQTGSYKGWAGFSQSTMQHFSACFQGLPVTNVTRVALRYVNRLEFRVPYEGLNAVLRLRPTWPAEFGSRVNASVTTLSLPILKESGTANVTLKIEQGADDTKIALYDIDVFQVGNFKYDLNGSIMRQLEALRAEKNRLFENGLTDATIAKYR